MEAKSSIASKPSKTRKLKMAVSSRTSNWLYRLSNAVMTLFFVYSSYVQINDPDSHIWISIYFLTALASYMRSLSPSPSSFKKILTPFSTFVISIAFILFCSTLTDSTYTHFIMPDLNELFNVHEENGRNRSGLVIVMIWMCVGLGLCAREERMLQTAELARRSEDENNGKDEGYHDEDRITILANESKFGLVGMVVLFMVACAVLGSAVLIPKYVMTLDDVRDLKHCRGVGVNPNGVEQLIREEQRPENDGKESPQQFMENWHQFLAQLPVRDGNGNLINEM